MESTNEKSLKFGHPDTKISSGIKINEMQVHLVLSVRERERDHTTRLFISTSTRCATSFSVSICAREKKAEDSIDE